MYEHTQYRHLTDAEFLSVAEAAQDPTDQHRRARPNCLTGSPNWWAANRSKPQQTASANKALTLLKKPARRA